MSEHDPELAAALRKLRAMLTESGFQHSAAARGRRQVTFDGQYREWRFIVHLRPDWFHAYAQVCALPKKPGLRSEVLLWLMRKNATLPLLKYSVTPSDQIVLECEVRAERLVAEEVQNIIGFLHATADEQYLELVRIASGDARFNALMGKIGETSSTNLEQSDAASDQ